MRGEQQLEIAKMRGQHQRSHAGLGSESAREMLEPLVLNPVLEPLVKEPAEANILRCRSSQVQVGLAKDVLAFRYALVRKGYFQILHSDPDMPAIESISDFSAQHSQGIENEVRNQAQQVQY